MARILSATLFLVLIAGAAVNGLNDTCSQPGYSDGNYKHPDDCHRFLQCNNGKTIEVDCPNGLFFNEAKRLCDQLQNVPRCQATTPGAPSTQPTTIPYIDIDKLCADRSYVDGSYPYPYSNICSKYIQCNNQLTTVVQCPNGLVYNEIRRLCDNAQDVSRCIDFGSAGTTTDLPVDLTTDYAQASTSSSSSSGDGDLKDYCRNNKLPDGSYINRQDCTSYIQCTNLNTAVVRCPLGTVYNGVLRLCDAPSNVPGCQPQTAPTPDGFTPPDSGYDTYCADNNLSTGIHPDPYSCLHFVECTFGRTDHMACPSGLSFSVPDLVCIESNKVDCRLNQKG